MRTLQDLYHDPRVLEPDPSLTAIACIQLALETFGIQVHIFNVVLKIENEGVYFQCCCPPVLQFWFISRNYHLKNYSRIYWSCDVAYHVLMEEYNMYFWYIGWYTTGQVPFVGTGEDERPWYRIISEKAHKEKLWEVNMTLTIGIWSLVP